MSSAPSAPGLPAGTAPAEPGEPASARQPAPAAGQGAADTAYYREILHGLIALGNDIAHHLHTEITARPNPQALPAADDTPRPRPVAEAVAAFDRVVRAIRRTIHLAQHLARDASSGPAAQQERARIASRKQILRTVEDTITRTRTETEQESLHQELRDRLDAPDLEDEIADRPTIEIINDILRDLGLAAVPGCANPWTRRTPTQAASLTARAAQPPRPKPKSPRPNPDPPPRPGGGRPPSAAPPPAAAGR
ncbi:MAG: hypothetical protein ACRYGM_19270 [Janthinobacterium lividum]